jgi:hypothetical protein
MGKAFKVVALTALVIITTPLGEIVALAVSLTRRHRRKVNANA